MQSVSSSVRATATGTEAPKQYVTVPINTLNRRQLPAVLIGLLLSTSAGTALAAEAEDKEAKLREAQRIAEQQRKAAERAALRDRMGRFIR